MSRFWVTGTIGTRLESSLDGDRGNAECALMAIAEHATRHESREIRVWALRMVYVHHDAILRAASERTPSAHLQGLSFGPRVCRAVTRLLEETALTLTPKRVWGSGPCPRFRGVPGDAEDIAAAQPYLESLGLASDDGSLVGEAWVAVTQTMTAEELDALTEVRGYQTI